MRVKFSAVLKDRHGKEITEGSPAAPVKVTLGDMACATLDAPQAGDTPADKARNWELMCKITAAQKSTAPIELLDADVKMIEERLGKMQALPAGLYGAAIAALHANKEPAAKVK